MLNLSVARSNMIKQQIRTWEIDNDKIVHLLGSIPREHFLPESLHQLAYADTMLPIGHNQVSLPPKELARAIAELDIQKHESVLEIGTGSSYGTALLAELGSHVHSVDIYEDFTAHAASALKSLGIENVTLSTGDAAQGWDLSKQYDVIVITGSLPLLPEAMRQQLTVGGRLFAILGEAPVMQASVILRTGDKSWDPTILFETNVQPLLNAAKPDKFEF